MMHVDPDGQWDWESVKSDALAYGSQAVDAANNVVSGATDEASMGATRWVRDKAGLGDTVNYDGAAYKAAQKTVEYGGYATGAVGLGLAIRKMGVKTLFKGAVHSADDAVELAAKKASKKRPPKPDCPLPGSPCFVAGTHVETEDGPADIETIEVGDWVWAADPETGVEGPRRVLSLFRTPDVPVLQVTVETRLGRETEVIETTAEHPFWVEGRGWVKGGELQTGDELRDIDAGALLVRSIAETQRRETVFNLEVEGVHTYFAGRLGVLVHNSCGSFKPPKTVKAAKGVKGKFSLDGYSFRIDTNKVATGEGGFHIHIFKKGKEIAKVSGTGSWAKAHKGARMAKPSEVNKQLRREVNQLVRYVSKRLGD